MVSPQLHWTRLLYLAYLNTTPIAASITHSQYFMSRRDSSGYLEKDSYKSRYLEHSLSHHHYGNTVNTYAYHCWQSYACLSKFRNKNFQASIIDQIPLDPGIQCIINYSITKLWSPRPQMKDILSHVTSPRTKRFNSGEMKLIQENLDHCCLRVFTKKECKAEATEMKSFRTLRLE